MQMRNFIKSAVQGSAAVVAGFPFEKADAASKLKITKIRCTVRRVTTNRCLIRPAALWNGNGRRNHWDRRRRFQGYD